MQLQTGTCSVTNGSNRIIASADNDWSQATVGSLFVVPGTAAVWYTIATKTVPGSSLSGRWEVTLSVNYAGTTNAATPYAIHKDFTPTGFPILTRGDIETALLINRIVTALEQNYLTAAGSLAGLGINTPRFLVSKNADQNHNFYSAGFAVTWPTEIEDTANGFASNAYTVQAGGAGLWEVRLQVFIDDISGGPGAGNGLFIRNNGTKIGGVRLGAYGNSTHTCTVVTALSVGNVLDVVSDCNSGSGHNIKGDALATRFAGRRLSI